MVYNCFISHTAACAGWKMDEYLTGFYKKACRTMRFPKNEDGNQMFNVAVNYGKFWDEGKWVKPKVEIKNEQCFELSLKNFVGTLRQGELITSRRI